MAENKSTVILRCHFDGGLVETSIESTDLNDLKKLLLNRFNLPAEINFEVNHITDQEIEVNAKNYSYNAYVAHYHYPKFSANKSLKSSQDK